MFECLISARVSTNNVFEWKAHIEGCPDNGLEAVDFRRRHGLPEEPSNKIKLPGYRWTDEEFVRNHQDKANSNADLDSDGLAGCQGRWRVNGVWELYRDSGDYTISGWQSNSGRHVYLTPAVIKAYLENQTPETGRAVFLDTWSGEQRSLVAGQEEIRRHQEEVALLEKAKEEARKLLAPELEKLQSKLASATRQIQGLEKELEKAQERQVEPKPACLGDEDDDE